LNLASYRNVMGATKTSSAPTFSKQMRLQAKLL